MRADSCRKCGGPTRQGQAAYVELGGPRVAVDEIPALVCGRCGHCHFPAGVRRRLEAILDEARDLALSEGLSEVDWSYTPAGPADLGALPAGIRHLVGRLQERLEGERRLSEATERAARETPLAFH